MGNLFKVKVQYKIRFIISMAFGSISLDPGRVHKFTSKSKIAIYYLFSSSFHEFSSNKKKKILLFVSSSIFGIVVDQTECLPPAMMSLDW